MNISPLRPVSGNHSISRVKATMHLPQAFLKPESVFEKIRSEECFTRYQKKGLTRFNSITVSNHQKKVDFRAEELIDGFVFEEYSEDRLGNILRVKNGDNMSTLSLESRLYDRWDSFISTFRRDLETISSKVELYFNAISLTYLDEFIWDSNDKIDVNSIFNKNSQVLNKKFLSSNNGSLSCLTQESTIESVKEEKVEISFNETIKRISILHQYALGLNDIVSFSDPNSKFDFLVEFNTAHETNKTVLKDVLSRSSLDLINLI